MTSLFSGSGLSGLSSNSYYGNWYSIETREKQHEAMAWDEMTNNFDAVEDTQINGECGKAQKFLEAIKDGQEDEAMEYYNELLDIMKQQDRYSKYDDAQIKADATALISVKLKELTGDDNAVLKDYIKKYTADTTENHKQRDRNNVEVDEATTEDILNFVCDDKVRKYDKTTPVGSFFRKAWAGFVGIFYKREGDV